MEIFIGLHLVRISAEINGQEGENTGNIKSTRDIENILQEATMPTETGEGNSFATHIFDIEEISFVILMLTNV